ncbi:5S rRNA binding protein [Aureococcus anophagefferens]|nr:5S rRNA binding protein [Aureococcus anophagefferens]
MPFVKIIKNKAYFKRYQVKYKRRREGKTDYRARKRLITQDKNKYNTPKYRLVVRFSNKYVTCAVHSSELVGDKCIATATSKELGRYGLKVGLDELYEGNTDPEGEVVKTEVGKKEYYVEELDDDKRPFKCILDVGIQTTTTGNRVFGALKGATDGGLDIPHNYKRFPGYDKESKEFDAEAMKDRIFGAHVSEYMEKLMDEDNAKYQQLFADYIKEGVEPDGMEDLYTSVHEAIREDPSPAEKEEFEVEDREAYKKTPKLTYEERKARVAAKKAEMEEDDEDDEDEEEEEEAEEAPKKADY